MQAALACIIKQFELNSFQHLNNLRATLKTFNCFLSICYLHSRDLWLYTARDCNSVVCLLNEPKNPTYQQFPDASGHI